MQPNAELCGILQRAFPGCRITACSELGGGVSARTVVAELVLEDTTTRPVVVRRLRHASAETALRLLAREQALLGRCVALGVPAPIPWHLDVQAAALVLEYVEGAPDLSPTDLTDMLRQMATQLARIHALAIGDDFNFLERRTSSAARDVSRGSEPPDLALDEPRLRSALAALWPWPQHNADVLLHGDYWPGNLLWRGGQLVAVLDWEEAEVGDPLSDVALSRLDIAWAFGEHAMQLFTRCYREQTEIDWQNLSRWDLCVALRPLSNLDEWVQVYASPAIRRPDVTLSGMRDGHRRFVEQALRDLQTVR